jgi:regulatory protein
MRGIGDALIASVLEEISEEEYEETLRAILSKKSKEIKESDPYKRKQKLVAFAMQRGFQPDLIYKILDQRSG